MSGSVTHFQASALASILQHAGHQLVIVQHSLLPKNIDGQHFECPGMQLNSHEQNLQKISKFRSSIIDVLAETVTSLLTDQTFTPLLSKAQELIDNDDQGILEYYQEQDNRITFLRSGVEGVSEQLSWMKNPSRKTLLLIQLDQTLQMEQIRSINKINYFTKFFNEKQKSCFKKLAQQEQLLRNELQTVKNKIMQEERCFHEWQSFLEINKVELENELEKQRNFFETALTEKENKIEMFRIRQRMFESETKRLKSIAEASLKEIKIWQEIRPRILGERSAITNLQAWWRNAIADDPDLLKPVKMKPKKQSKRK